MAGFKKGLKNLFSDTRSRIIIVFMLGLVFTGIIIGVVKFRQSFSPSAPASSIRGNTGGIQSIPGALNPTEQYAGLQHTQNVQQAQMAQQTGGSAIPTIIRSQLISSAGFKSQDMGEGGLGFSALSREAGGIKKDLWLDSLRSSQCSAAAVSKAVRQGGVTLNQLVKVCSCVQLKASGYSVRQLQPVCSCKELKKAGFNALQLKEAGFDAGQLRGCGFDACELKGAGFSVAQMHDAGFSDGELKGAGFSERAIKLASGLPDGVTAQDVIRAGCSVEALKKLRATGVTAAAIRRTSGCSPAQLRAAGFTAKELRDAGFTAAELAKAGFSAAELKVAGFSAADLAKAGFSAKELASLGYSAEDIAASGAGLRGSIKCDPASLKAARAVGITAAEIRKTSGCTAAQMKAAGFTAKELKDAGFSAAELKDAGFTAKELKDAGFSAAELKVAGFSAKELKDAGFNAAELKAAGFSATDLAQGGFGAAELKAAGFTDTEIATDQATIFKSIKCDPASLKAARAAGVTAVEIRKTSGCTAAQMKAAGFTAAELKAAGFSAKELKEAGFSAAELKAAGFSAADLAQASFSAAELKAAGFTDAEIVVAQAATRGPISCDPASLRAARAAGITATEIRKTSGCTAAQMKAAGFTAKELKDAGFTAAELRAAGFSAKDLKDAGFSAKDLKDAGFSAAELKATGFSARDLKDAGFSAAELKAAGFSAKELKNAGFSAKDLKDAGFSPADLKDAGFSAAELKAAGFSAKELKNAGFNANDLKDAGFSPADLKDAGFSAAELKAAGFSAIELAKAGFSTGALNEAGFSPQEIQNAIQATSGIPIEQTAVGMATAGGRLGGLGNNNQKLKEIVARQASQAAQQKIQQGIQQRTALMTAKANQLLSAWDQSPTQAVVSGNGAVAADGAGGGLSEVGRGFQCRNVCDAKGLNCTRVCSYGQKKAGQTSEDENMQGAEASGPIIKAGDILFAVLDTSVNSDEPGPILATIVTGKFKGSRLIGSFTLPGNNAQKLILSFNTMSVPEFSGTIGISAVAIDPNTARTALSSDTNNHYLQKYGMLFASSFLEGFGNSYQSANTTITVGGDTNSSYTVTSATGQSALENSVIALADVGKAFGTVAQQQVNRPPTIQVYAGTGLGILFTRDIAKPTQ